MNQFSKMNIRQPTLDWEPRPIAPYQPRPQTRINLTIDGYHIGQKGGRRQEKCETGMTDQDMRNATRRAAWALRWRDLFGCFPQSYKQESK